MVLLEIKTHISCRVSQGSGFVIFDTPSSFALFRWDADARFCALHLNKNCSWRIPLIVENGLHVRTPKSFPRSCEWADADSCTGLSRSCDFESIRTGPRSVPTIEVASVHKYMINIKQEHKRFKWPCFKYSRNRSCEAELVRIEGNINQLLAIPKCLQSPHSCSSSYGFSKRRYLRDYVASLTTKCGSF